MLASNRIEIGTDGPLTNVSLEPTYSLYLHRLRKNYVFGLTRRTTSSHKSYSGLPFSRKTTSSCAPASLQ